MRRTYVATVLVAAVVSLWLLYAGRGHMAVGALAGSGIGIAALWAVVATATGLARTSEGRPGRAAALAGAIVLKYMLLGAVLYVVLYVARADAGGLAIGLGLPLAVLLMRAAGRRWADATMGRGSGPADRG